MTDRYVVAALALPFCALMLANLFGWVDQSVDVLHRRWPRWFD